MSNQLRDKDLCKVVGSLGDIYVISYGSSQTSLSMLSCSNSRTGDANAAANADTVVTAD